MQRTRRSLIIIAAGLGVATAVAAAPMAAADENPLLPGCEVTGGSVISGGQTTDCASPGNVQIDSTPQFFPGESQFWGFPGFGFI